MKYCKDCKHFVPDGDLCQKSVPYPDYVYGRPRPLKKAHDMRVWTLKDDCTPEARFFEPKESV